MYNQVWYYRADATGRHLVNDKEYLSTVDTVKLTSQYAVVLSEGRVHIHSIEGTGERGAVVSIAVFGASVCTTLWCGGRCYRYIVSKCRLHAYRWLFAQASSSFSSI